MVSKQQHSWVLPLCTATVRYRAGRQELLLVRLCAKLPLAPGAPLDKLLRERAQHRHRAERRQQHLPSGRRTCARKRVGSESE